MTSQVVYTQSSLILSTEPVFQVGFVCGNNWKLIGKKCSCSGLSMFATIPVCDCPIIDISQCKIDTTAAIRRHVNIEGVHNLDALIDELVAVGASVSYPVHFSIAQS